MALMLEGSVYSKGEMKYVALKAQFLGQMMNNNSKMSVLLGEKKSGP
jgi:hypothetical protein